MLDVTGVKVLHLSHGTVTIRDAANGLIVIELPGTLDFRDRLEITSKPPVFDPVVLGFDFAKPLTFKCEPPPGGFIALMRALNRPQPIGRRGDSTRAQQRAAHKRRHPWERR